MVFFEELQYTQESDETLSFDNSQYGELLGADIGHAITTEGTSVQRHYTDHHDDVLRESHPSAMFDERQWVTNDELFAGDVRLRTGETVRVTDYDVVLVSQVVFHVPYIDYLTRQYPELSVIPIQDESLYEVQSLSATLQARQLEALRRVDGFVALDRVYHRWVSGLVDDAIRVPLLVPEGGFDGAEPTADADRGACLGCAPFNVDSSHFNTSIVVLESLREAGHDLSGEIIGVRDWQRKVLDGFERELPYVSLHGFIDEGFHEYLSGFEIGILLSPRVSAGRFSAEMAAMGVPCIGNVHNELQRRCFPELSVEIHETQEAAALADRLLSDAAFYRETVERATEAVRELQDYDAVKTRLERYVESV